MDFELGFESIAARASSSSDEENSLAHPAAEFVPSVDFEPIADFEHGFAPLGGLGGGQLPIAAKAAPIVKLDKSEAERAAVANAHGPSMALSTPRVPQSKNNKNIILKIL